MPSTSFLSLLPLPSPPLPALANAQARTSFGIGAVCVCFFVVVHLYVRQAKSLGAPHERRRVVARPKANKSLCCGVAQEWSLCIRTVRHVQQNQWKLRTTNGARDLCSSRPTDSPLALPRCANPHWYRIVVLGTLRSRGPSRRRNPKVGPNCTSGERGCADSFLSPIVGTNVDVSSRAKNK